jgi:DNA-binding transcriptional regulator YiaG
MANSQLTTEEIQSETWVTIPLWEAYQISSLGRVRRITGRASTCRDGILTPALRNHYLFVTLRAPGRRCSASIHRLVAAAFLGPCPDGQQVNHRDTVKTNNRSTNLEYVTPQENTRHARAHGLMPFGGKHYSAVHPELVPRGDDHWTHKHPEMVRRGDQTTARLHPESLRRGTAHHSAKLTEDNVRSIRRLLAEGVSQRELAREYGVSQTAIRYVKQGRNWGHLA